MSLKKNTVPVESRCLAEDRHKDGGTWEVPLWIKLVVEKLFLQASLNDSLPPMEPKSSLSQTWKMPRAPELLLLLLLFQLQRNLCSWRQTGLPWTVSWGREEGRSLAKSRRQRNITPHMTFLPCHLLQVTRHRPVLHGSLLWVSLPSLILSILSLQCSTTIHLFDRY